MIARSIVLLLGYAYSWCCQILLIKVFYALLEAGSYLPGLHCDRLEEISFVDRNLRYDVVLLIAKRHKER